MLGMFEMKKVGRLATLLLILMSSSRVVADITVIAVDPNEVPFDLSKNSYKNSPTSYKNSSNTYANSETTYANSSSTFDNSLSNSRNGMSGKNRLFSSDGEYLGYYVLNDGGVLNFYGQDGERFAFNPHDETQSVFMSRGDIWCGVIAMDEGEAILGLSKRCYFLLLSMSD